MSENKKPLYGKGYKMRITGFPHFHELKMLRLGGALISLL
jgi:hypothetical protein